MKDFDKDDDDKKKHEKENKKSSSGMKLIEFKVFELIELLSDFMLIFIAIFMWLCSPKK
jgi:hypothetical protein